MLGFAIGLVALLAGPTLATPPSISGTLQQGAKLTATAGSWAGSGTITYAYQWYRCTSSGSHCSSIHGATTGRYTEVAADIGHTIGLTVRATDSTGTTPAYAPLAGLVAAAGSALSPATQPTLAGTVTSGAVLTVTPGTWSGSPTAFTYTWLRCNPNGRVCTAIAGATTASYTLTTDDSGHTIVATVDATAGTATQAVLTVASAVVP